MMAATTRLDTKALSIPDVVARYLRYAIPGNRRILTATVKQEGAFRFGSSGQHWRPFTATERFSADRPAFEWDAAIRVAPMLTVRVRDTYEQGIGATSASLLGHTFFRSKPARELNAGALQRFLAEAIWFPSVLVAGPGITWRGVNRETAIATIRDGLNSVALQFTFNEVGEVTEIFAPARYRSVGGAYEETPWLVRCADYVEADGFRVPRQCEVGWVLDQEPFIYWKGRACEVRYECAAELPIESWREGSHLKAS